MPIEDVHWNLSRVLAPIIDDLERIATMSEAERRELGEFGVNGFKGEHSVTALYVLLGKLEYLAARDLKTLKGELNMADEEVARRLILEVIQHDAEELFNAHEVLSELQQDVQELARVPLQKRTATAMMEAVAKAIKHLAHVRVTLQS